MSAATLLVTAIVALASAGVYTYLGMMIRRRPATGSDLDALHAFAQWWFGLALLNLTSAVLNPLAALGLLDIHFLVTIVVASVLVMCAALWGLTYYLVYLFTGSRLLRVPLGVGYTAYYLWLMYYFLSAGPTSYAVGTWGIRYEYQAQPGPGAGIVLSLLMLGPTLLGALAYFTLFFRVRDPEQRYRIALLALSVIVWFGSSLTATLTGFTDWVHWPIVNRFIALGASLMILLAYRPPLAIRLRLGRPPVPVPAPNA